MRALLLASVIVLPAAAQTVFQTPEQRAQLDQLLGALSEATDPAAAAGLEVRIEKAWQLAGGPTAALMLNAAARHLQSGDGEAALADADAALTLSPDLTEAFYRRGAARYQRGDVAGAYHDLEETVRREPRHFAAWRLLSEIADAQGNSRAALAAWRQLLALDPQTEDADKKLQELTRKVQGEAS